MKCAAKMLDCLPVTEGVMAGHIFFKWFSITCNLVIEKGEVYWKDCSNVLFKNKNIENFMTLRSKKDIVRLTNKNWTSVSKNYTKIIFSKMLKSKE